MLGNAGVFRKDLAVLLAVLWSLGTPNSGNAEIIVPSGFEVQEWTVPGATKIEAIRNTAYGEGVMGVYVTADTLVLWRCDYSGTIEDFARFPVISDTYVNGIRFDRVGTYGHMLLLNRRRGLTETTIATVSPEGSMTDRVSFGSSVDGMSGELEISFGTVGYEQGIYFYDCYHPQGQPMLHMDEGFSLTTIIPDAMPPDRGDIDGCDMKMDPLGAFGLYLTLTDSDLNDDYLSAIYQITPAMEWRELVPPAGTSERVFRGFAFGVLGAFGHSLYVADDGAKRVWTVSPEGNLTEFASGFSSIYHMTMSEDGMHLWMANDSTLYHVRSTQPAADSPVNMPCRPVLLSPYPNPSAGVVHMPYFAPKPGYMRFSVCDLLGRKLRQIEDFVNDSGYHRVSWDGRDDAGCPVPPGSYMIMPTHERGTDAICMIRLP